MTDMTDFGEGHTLEDREPQPSDGPEYHADHQAWQERQHQQNTAGEGCEKCAAAQVAGYALCVEHREFIGLGAVIGHSYVTQDGAAHDIEMQTERNALRTWRPQLVHYHGSMEPCNEKCHQVFPNDLPYWGGANPPGTHGE